MIFEKHQGAAHDVKKQGRPIAGGDNMRRFGESQRKVNPRYGIGINLVHQGNEQRFNNQQSQSKQPQLAKMGYGEVSIQSQEFGYYSQAANVH